MEDNYIMLNGKMVPLTEEQIAALLGGKETACAKVDPFERKIGEKYVFIGMNGYVREWSDLDTSLDEIGYNTGNYCRDKELMKQRAMHETLNRLLWRYSEQHGGDNEWDGNNPHFYIVIDDKEEPKFSNSVYCRNVSVIYFRKMETAICAIEDIVKPFLAEHPDFVW